MALAQTPKMAEEGKFPPIPKPHPGSDGSSSGTYVNPLHGNPPPDLGSPAPQPKSADPDGSAYLIAEGVNALVTIRYAYPLTDQEKADLQRDLAPVLAKYNVPDVPFGPELKLGANLVGIGMRRHAHEQQQKAAMRAAQGKGGARDSSGVRKEGEREVVSAEEVRGNGGFASPADFLP